MIKKLKLAWVGRIALFFTLFLGAINMAQAGPANPQPLQIAQPDGTMIQVMMRGDEFQGWMETSDGYTIVKNSSSGFYEYANQNSSGQLASSGFVVSAAVKSQLATQGLMPRKGLRPPPNTDLQKYQKDFLSAARAKRVSGISPGMSSAPSGTWAPTPVSGTKKILVLLVNFQNASLSSGAASYWSNAVHNATGSSVTKYYRDNSFGTLAVSAVAHTQPGGTAGVVTVSLPQGHPNCGGSCSYSTESTWINSALAAAVPYVNFPALDSNGDGTIAVDEALIYFVVAGYEAAAGNGTPSIWAHAWGGPNVRVSGKNVNHWALNGEMYSASSRMQMGVIAHEMGHAMGGLPDLYDISGSNAGLGIFSLMATGSWGARSGEIGGTTPVNLDAWSRQYLGWSNPQTPTSNATMSFGSALSSTGASVMLMNSASSTSEYWLIENRPPVGWDAGMYLYLRSWTGGLLIQHIDLNVGSKSDNSFNEYLSGLHQGSMAVEPSTATCSLVSTSSPSAGCPNILFYAGNSATFNSGSTPRSNYYNGTASNMGISGVSSPGNTMTAVVQVTTNNFTLAVAKAGTGAGTVTSNPAGISCGAACSASYSTGTSVALSAVPAAGSVFAGWTGSCTGTGSCLVSMTAARSVRATFNASTLKYTLAVTKAGTGAGTVTSNPAGISCGAACSASYRTGTNVTLSALPAAGSVFAGWTGACTGTGSCVVSMTAARSVRATFNVLPMYTMAVSKAGTGTVTSNPAGISCGAACSASYRTGTNVTLSALPAAGSVFAGWTGSCTGTGSCVVSMTAARSVRATFNVLPMYTMAVSKAGTGTVTSSPAGINCGAVCSAAYRAGTSVALSAVPAAGSVFAGWTGACMGTGNCVVSMTAARSVRATFNASTLKYTLAVAKAGTGAGTVTSNPAGISCGAACSASYRTGTNVTLSALPAAGSVFAGWTGACTGTGNCVVSMTAARSVGATFGGLTNLISLGEAVDNTSLAWSTSGNKNWFGQTIVTFNGGDAAQSGRILDEQRTVIRATVVGPGVLSYRWKISSEPGYDWMTFYFNGWAQSGRISGQVTWGYQGWIIPAGTHVVEWAYQKDMSVTMGSDAAWLDQVVFTK